jgi:AcrR family transcriptional regulator
VHRRARSGEDKLRRAEDLLDAARALAAERGGVRYVTLAAVTEAAGLHPSAVRRYFESREELLLELAERGWTQWRDALRAQIADARGLGPREVATAVSTTIASLPLFCDLSPTYRSASKVRSASTEPAATKRAPSPPTTPSSMRSVPPAP